MRRPISKWTRKKVRSPSPTPVSYFFFSESASTKIYTLSLHDALPIYRASALAICARLDHLPLAIELAGADRSEEHTSELQSRRDLVCRLLLEKKNKERDTVGAFKVEQDFLRPISRREAYLADITYGTY